eukprot:TRINITY_DN26928_c0_g1_i1.p1 TRINITY_DN26928_c0_g1~~TRINITY_DN26928_c0_g1_i1.p1  ORF type:complete len:757 (+),score=190.56 TRINITY_DN26928_c0_g1_i1:84-2354(+)
MEPDDSVIERFVFEQVPFEKLPVFVKKRLESSKDVWKDRVYKFSLKHQLRWRTNLVKSFSEERAYYVDMLKLCKTSLTLFPYHLSDVMVRSLRVTPFRYYLEIIENVMRNEFSYDRVPNFTAVDCVRLLGIGRNEFIDTMNKCRSMGWMWKKKKNGIFELLPQFARPISIEHWWLVCLGFVTDDDARRCSDAERAIIDALHHSGPRQAGEFDRASVVALHIKGLIYLDIPIESDDFLSVPPLENFVMNRVGGDFFESLLYKIFVSIDERTSVDKLAAVLDIDIELIKQAMSLYCRLGFAIRKSAEPLKPDPANPYARPMRSAWHTSWLRAAEQATAANNSYLKMRVKSVPDTFIYGAADTFVNAQHAQPDAAADARPVRSPEASGDGRRIGFVFDYTLAALLMMGNLGSGLKSHAVTMYEVGKLPEESLYDLLLELDKIDGHAEGEAVRYYDHAITLRHVLRFLQATRGVDMLRSERLQTSLEPAIRERMMRQNYSLLISMAPISPETPAITSTIPQHFGPALPEVNTPWFSMYFYGRVGAGPPATLFSKGTRVRLLPRAFTDYEYERLSQWNKDPSVVSVNTLLPTLNEALLESPVLVQAFGRSKEPLIVDVPFPLADAEPGAPEPAEYTADNLHLHPLVRHVQDTMGLTMSFGFIRMLFLEDSSVAERRNWVPLEFFLGLPLFSLSLCQAVCDRIASHQLFSDENLKRFSVQQRYLSIDVLDFINKYQDEELVFDETTVPYPARTLQFLNGVVT